MTARNISRIGIWTILAAALLVPTFPAAPGLQTQEATLKNYCVATTWQPVCAFQCHSWGDFVEVHVGGDGFVHGAAKCGQFQLPVAECWGWEWCHDAGSHSGFRTTGYCYLYDGDFAHCRSFPTWME